MKLSLCPRGPSGRDFPSSRAKSSLSQRFSSVFPALFPAPALAERGTRIPARREMRELRSCPWGRGNHPAQLSAAGSRCPGIQWEFWLWESPKSRFYYPSLKLDQQVTWRGHIPGREKPLLPRDLDFSVRSLRPCELPELFLPFPGAPLAPG